MYIADAVIKRGGARSSCARAVNATAKISQNSVISELIILRLLMRSTTFPRVDSWKRNLGLQENLFGSSVEGVVDHYRPW